RANQDEEDQRLSGDRRETGKGGLEEKISMTSQEKCAINFSTGFGTQPRFTAGDTYDNNGNTVSSGGTVNVYDFENHLIQKDGVSMVYDGDGNRVKKTVAGVTTLFLVDDLNPTGYAQAVAEEAQSTAALSSYIYGLDLIVRVKQSGTPPTVFYVHDGHGSVRALTNTAGTVTDTYDYDAFGNLIHSTGTTPNNYLFAGEQYDPDLHLYYNRARYLNTNTGRFWTMDPYEGDPQSPASLHRYLYATNDPVDLIDPSGRQLDLLDVTITATIASTIAGISTFAVTGSIKQASAVAAITFLGIEAVGTLYVVEVGAGALAALQELEYIGGLLATGAKNQAFAYVIGLSASPQGQALLRQVHIQVSQLISSSEAVELGGPEFFNLLQELLDLTGKFLQ
ncbi:MAG TPA: RHS repeat-associated core domain-containing protein, partial [Candidatus Acidoferrales bacterium]|nr:RHS repeat-associated core domain-containing protein [Candidatus Acidoferrales bacterium]